MNEIKIIYEDDDILILNKPSGMIVNKADTTRNEFTVQDWLEQRFKIQDSKFKNENEHDFYRRAGIVHRIDKETSGILVVAKNIESFENLQAQFKERKVEKTYVALAHGKIEPQEGEIAAAVGRLPWNRKRFGVLAGGKEAVTKYQVLGIKYLVSGKQEEPLTLLELYPKTGRTHQIRVHLKYINHPIFGDELYAGRKTSRDDRVILQRFFLHAKKISFFHPKTASNAASAESDSASQKRIEFEASLPRELQTVLDSLED